MTQRDRAYVWLSLSEGLGPRRIARLLAMCADPLVLIGLGAAEWAGAVGGAVASNMAKARSRVDDVTAALERDGVRVITLESGEYPERLREVYDPPIALYALGDLALDQRSAIAMVGSRGCTRYGRDVAFRIAAELAEAGVCVVSGLARGIDTACHAGALSVRDGKTIAVLGCGVDVVYPPENGKMFAEIAARGALVSEYLPGTGPLKAHFPLRNRVISGMSSAVVLVEGAKGSGAMITVDYALEHGREIFAVPGNITSAKSFEPNRLIREGAGIVTSSRDILEGVGWAVSAQKPRENRAEVQLSIDEALIVAAAKDQDASFAELLQETGLDAATLNSHLTMLTLRGIMKQSAGRIFSVNRMN